MKPNRIRQVAAEGRVPVGHMLMEFDTPGVAKLCETADLDFVILDMEHGPLSISQVAGLIARLKATPITPIVRIPASEYHFVARVMDAGARGIMAPNVRTAEQARLLNAAMRYAPDGNRGLGLGVAHNDFVRPNSKQYMAEANSTNILICQIESRTALRNLEKIATEPGVDCLWVGHMDLSQSMGIVEEFHSEEFLAAMRRVTDTARDQGLFAGIQPGSPQQAKEWMALGFDLISYSTDIGIYSAGLAAGVDAVRQAAPQS